MRIKMITINKNNNIIIGLWLLILTIMVYIIILIGGLTRLTDSGLSMVDWRPLMGIFPPLIQQDWIDIFNQYRKSPQYLIVNKNMELDEFKYIFWWEYFHRLFARIIGFVFIIPFFYFVLKKYLSINLIICLSFVFALGILQAIVGWWMVKSGLNNDPFVSQYRLSFHLIMAITILSILLWMTLNKLLIINNSTQSLILIKRLIFISLILCLITIISGSFVAATDAGQSYNTFPLMNGQLIPDEYLIEKNIFKNSFENTIAIQFNHRWFAIFTFFWTIIVMGYAFSKKITLIQKISCLAVIVIITFQVIIGILTLIYLVPIILASIHQANSILLYCSLLITFYLFSNKKFKT